jgi:hypothetical protein
VTGVPNGIFFNYDNSSLIGSPIYTGIFTGYIGYLQPIKTGISFNIQVNPNVNTGFLYAFGSGGAYAENVVPDNFTGIFFNQIYAGNWYNFGVVTQNYFVPLLVSPTPTPTPTPTATPLVQQYNCNYTFLLTNNSNKPCIDDFTLTSSFTGINTGIYLTDPLSFGYVGGDQGVTSKDYVVCSGYIINRY